MHANRVVPVFLLAGGTLLLILAGCAGPEAAPTEAPVATAAPVITEAPALSGNPVRGGQLYDKWWAVLELDEPEGDHPLWATQSTNTRSGADTWRCKECHGWDYKGKDGLYGSGSHMTGFPGVMNMSGKDPNEALATLQGSTSPDHDFSTLMEEQALIDLALFMSQNLMDPAEIVNADKSLVGGSSTEGATEFALCAACHGIQGTAVNFGNESETEYLGTVAADNPWEFLHKERFGQPGVIVMPAGVSMNRPQEDYADLLAYIQTLPTSSPVTEGGRLYDKWWEAMGAEKPEGDHPLWATQSTSTASGADTWRCKECHGWDYKGADGVYGSGSHFTGFKGILAASEMSAEDLTAWLSGGMNPDHDFSGQLGESQVAMLVSFIQDGVVDVSSFINADKTVNGDAQHGATLFGTICVRCHGADGKTINFGDEAEPEYVGTVGADNPWEAFHKARVGQPGTQMPAGLNFGWTVQDIADLIAYLQTLPTK
jgi:thiosulfate dehydrogenase